MNNQSSHHFLVRNFSRLVILSSIVSLITFILHSSPSSDYQTKSMLDNFISIYWMVLCLFLFFIGPIFLLYLLFAYLPHKFPLSKIPPDSSLYDAIMSYTVQEGAIKVVFPLIDDVLFRDHEENLDPLSPMISGCEIGQNDNPED